MFKKKKDLYDEFQISFHKFCELYDNYLETNNYYKKLVDSKEIEVLTEETQDFESFKNLLTKERENKVYNILLDGNPSIQLTYN